MTSLQMKRKAFCSNSEIVPNKMLCKSTSFHSFRNIFEVKNVTPFFTTSSVLPIMDSLFIEKDPKIALFTEYIHYMPSNNIFYEKYMMNNEIVFEVFNGREELLISRKTSSKVRVVYVNDKKRIERFYDRKGKEKELKCYDENGEKLLFHRKISADSYVSHLYNIDSQIIRVWNE